MKPAHWFIAGAGTVLVLQGAWALHDAITYEPQKVAPQATVHREVVFTVMAPKGMEDFGYVMLDCKPNMRSSKVRSGRK